MSVILIVLIIGFAIAAGTALVRGLMAFHHDAQQIRDGIDPSISQPGIRQNRMMIQRVIFQGIAVLLIAVLGLMFGKM
jgi:hypothetical protein